jgi:hypothetical protein
LQMILSSQLNPVFLISQEQKFLASGCNLITVTNRSSVHLHLIQ